MAANEAVFRYGTNIQTQDFVPSADVSSGEVVVIADMLGISLLPIKSGELGSLNISGGVYKVATDAAIAVGKKVWWNSTANQITETASTHKFFGVTITASGAAAGTCDCAHFPAGTVT